jgi:hypothetical protein
LHDRAYRGYNTAVFTIKRAGSEPGKEAIA